MPNNRRHSDGFFIAAGLHYKAARAAGVSYKENVWE
ncbi:hypothetical protein Kkor_0070 [Kangiella koreensis DSM 16069]|uniref:Uncharacterized protein n=1 Tax=Kangiella koreensis (strain DSM 16069 / JCM 12317 / KCTC 12182 / SW-125) TaxID=523791 RepID=C7R661_KANKD|nr:hypothetical protein Kkor_0070 [Kangiella koreensis DSM 16069]